MKEDILVSICCITYNQEEYIRDALEGFLMQKTNFKYEIIIHDDASTDNTVEIIKEYEEKYPDIIKTICQKENQYSKGIKIVPLVLEKVQGKYITICEGDDYWTDENKLQLQVDYMEANEKCTFCFHNAKILNMRSNKMSTLIEKKYTKGKEDYSPEDLLMIDYVGKIPTASFMFKKENTEKLPDWYFQSICEDLPLKLIMTNYGYAHYIDKEMSVYRRGTGKSLTDKWSEENKDNEKVVKNINEFIKIIENFDKFSKYKYTQTINRTKEYYKMEILYAQKKFKEIFTTNLAQYYKDAYNDKFYIKHIIKNYFKKLYLIYKKIFK